jgi:AraC family ethanolamine operon transcriptional activator
MSFATGLFEVPTRFAQLFPARRALRRVHAGRTSPYRGDMACITFDSEARRTARQALVARAVTLLRDRLTEPVTMAEVSREAGVSERTLRAAFHDVVGLSPKQYALTDRLRSAREALQAAAPGTTTVTEVATAHGFFELGRFAGRYRAAFGELPSRTLRGVTARQAEEAA